MCPECGGTVTRVLNASHDPEGNRIRRRSCEGCGSTFPTVEVPFPFSFHEADADKREAPAYSSRIKVSEYEPSRFEFEHQAGRYPTVTVTLKRSSKLPRCRKGIHVMRGRNVYRHPRGHSVCNACRREAANALYRDHLSPVTSVSARRNRGEAA